MGLDEAESMPRLYARVEPSNSNRDATLGPHPFRVVHEIVVIFSRSLARARQCAAWQSEIVHTGGRSPLERKTSVFVDDPIQLSIHPGGQHSVVSEFQDREDWLK